MATFKPGDRVYLVGGSFETCGFGIWTGTVTEGGGTSCWVQRDGDSAGVWTVDTMFRDRRAAVSYANQRLVEHQKSLAAQLESTFKQYADAVANCAATVDAPELVRS